MINIGDVYIVRVKVEKPKEIVDYLGADLQMVSVECWKPVAFAAILTERSFGRGTNHAKTLGGEFLLRLAGTLQIREAIASVGLKPGPNYAVAFNEGGLEKLKRLNLEELELLECDEDTAKTFFEKSALVEVL